MAQPSASPPAPVLSAEVLGSGGCGSFFRRRRRHGAFGSETLLFFGVVLCSCPFSVVPCPGVVRSLLVSASNLAPLNHIGACFHLSARKKLQHLLHFCCFPCFGSRHSTTTVLLSEHVRAADHFFVAHFVVAVPTLLYVLWFLVVMGRCSGGMIRLEVVRLRQRW